MLAFLSVGFLVGATFTNAACPATINSLADVNAAVQCTEITLNGFTVPAGQGLSLNLVSGTTVTMNGDIVFGNKSWAGPLFTISGTSVTFNGNGHKFNGGGPFYWDGKGLANGVQKPNPMMKIKMSGTFINTQVVNSPAAVFSLGNSAPLTISGITIDNSQGDAITSYSGGKAAGHNTDGFDVSTNDVIIRNSSIHNQDDCLAINKGTNIVFKDNTCTGGNGISLGSIGSGVKVSGVVISGNTITNSAQALRIKTQSSASKSTVSNVTYSGNTATAIRRFGVIIDQSYPATLGSPGSGVTLSGINFVSPTTTISVNSAAVQVAVNCGKGSCKGSWDWSGLQVSGGTTRPVTNFADGIAGFY